MGEGEREGGKGFPNVQKERGRLTIKVGKISSKGYQTFSWKVA